MERLRKIIAERSGAGGRPRGGLLQPSIRAAAEICCDVARVRKQALQEPVLRATGTEGNPLVFRRRSCEARLVAAAPGSSSGLFQRGHSGQLPAIAR